jgi:hypothetical protein
MKGILVEPDHVAQRTVVTEVDVAQDAHGDARLEHLYQLLGCSQVQIQQLASDGRFAGHAFVADENGLLSAQCGYLFMPTLHPAPLAGAILILGYGNGPAGPGLRPATVTAADLRAVGTCAYCTPKFAKAALRMHEAEIRQRFPGVVVVPGSENIRL